MDHQLLHDAMIKYLIIQLCRCVDPTIQKINEFSMNNDEMCVIDITWNQIC